MQNFVVQKLIFELQNFAVKNNTDLNKNSHTSRFQNNQILHHRFCKKNSILLLIFIVIIGKGDKISL
jgi:hypothetical protein